MRQSILLIALLFQLTFAQSQSWPAATPAAVGMIEDSLKSFDKDISNGRYGYVDALSVIRNGKLVFDKRYKNDYIKIYGDSAKRKNGLNMLDPSGQYNYYNSWWHPYYQKGELHSLQSVTKTITSVIIGIAVTKKEFPDINTPVLNFFDISQIKNIDDRKRKMTIKHLLTMTAGIDWDENIHYSDPRNDCTIMESSFDWIDYVINRPMAQEPGTVFRYNSGASQILSYIFRKSTGKDIEEYAVENLFKPLGIDSHFWKRTPTGLCDTEGGLYLRTTDLARIFYLFLKNGNWNGKQIVSEDWVKASVASSINIGPTVQYGYKWWRFAYGDGSKFVWAGSGFGGQVPIVIPEYDLVIVVNAWNILDHGRGLGTNEIVKRILSAVRK